MNVAKIYRKGERDREAMRDQLCVYLAPAFTKFPQNQTQLMFVFSISVQNGQNGGDGGYRRR